MNAPHTQRQWHELTPAEQAAEWAAYNAAMRWATPRQTRPGSNVLAVASVALGVVGLLILPIVFSTTAVLAGVIGWSVARETGRGKAGTAIVGTLIGVLGFLGWAAMVGLV